MPTNTQHGYDPANYYVWRTPGGFSVHLSLQVVRELTAEIATSGDTCGILLGRSVATPFPATIADAAGRHWPTSDVVYASILVSLFVMSVLLDSSGSPDSVLTLMLPPQTIQMNGS